VSVALALAQLPDVASLIPKKGLAP